jgi:hypothetical protein
MYCHHVWLSSQIIPAWIQDAYFQRSGQYRVQGAGTVGIDHRGTDGIFQQIPFIAQDMPHGILLQCPIGLFPN